MKQNELLYVIQCAYNALTHDDVHAAKSYLSQAIHKCEHNHVATSASGKELEQLIREITNSDEMICFYLVDGVFYLKLNPMLIVLNELPKWGRLINVTDEVYNYTCRIVQTDYYMEYDLPSMYTLENKLKYYGEELMCRVDDKGPVFNCTDLVTVLKLTGATSCRSTAQPVWDKAYALFIGDGLSVYLRHAPLPEYYLLPNSGVFKLEDIVR